MKSLHKIFQEHNIEIDKEDCMDNQIILMSNIFDYTKRRKMVIYNLNRVLYGDGKLRKPIVTDVVDEFLRDM